jgi:hypothetical protein
MEQVIREIIDTIRGIIRPRRPQPVPVPVRVRRGPWASTRALLATLIAPLRSRRYERGDAYDTPQETGETYENLRES